MYIFYHSLIQRLLEKDLDNWEQKRVTRLKGSTTHLLLTKSKPENIMEPGDGK
jgi:hypothetical protein